MVTLLVSIAVWKVLNGPLLRTTVAAVGFDLSAYPTSISAVVVTLCLAMVFPGAPYEFRVLFILY